MEETCIISRLLLVLEPKTALRNPKQTRRDFLLLPHHQAHCCLESGFSFSLWQ
jgi:hypothetical protein